MTGAVAAAQFSIAASVPISAQLHNQSLYASAVNSTATASYQIASSGNVIGNGATLEAWLIGTGANSSSYEVMATQSSGSAVSGTLGSWLNCGTNRSWSISNGARNNSVITGVISVQIRDVATQTVQASASITLSAESDSFN